MNIYIFLRGKCKGYRVVSLEKNTNKLVNTCFARPYRPRLTCTYQPQRPTVRQAMRANVLSATKKCVQQQQNMCPHVVYALTGRAPCMAPSRRICFSLQAIWISRSINICLRSKCILINKNALLNDITLYSTKETQTRRLQRSQRVDNFLDPYYCPLHVLSYN